MALLRDLWIPHYAMAAMCHASKIGRSGTGREISVTMPQRGVSRDVSLVRNRNGKRRKPGMQRDTIAHVPAPSSAWCQSRRGLLERAGWAVAAAGFSGVRALAADSVSPAMAFLSSYMS